MIWALSIVSFFSICAVVGLALALRKALERIQELVEFNESVNEDLENVFEKIDDAFKDLSHAARGEVLYDDPTVRKVITSMKASRNAIIEAAVRLSSSENRMTNLNDDKTGNSSKEA